MPFVSCYMPYTSGFISLYNERLRKIGFSGSEDVKLSRSGSIMGYGWQSACRYAVAMKMMLFSLCNARWTRLYQAL